jgi:hypothetical protein
MLQKQNRLEMDQVKRLSFQTAINYRQNMETINLLVDQLVDEKCNLFDKFGLYVQLVLGLISFSILILKKKYDIKKRTWKIWLMDTSK